ncbi:MAG TPA: hypothetical protein VEY93_15055 [Longimicrobium sp.]|nr:hypothetical protein [Longimicrobium sp.]
MRNPRLLPACLRAAGMVCAMAMAAACDDGALLSEKDTCATLRQSQAEIQEGRSEGKARVRLNVISRLGVEANSTEQVTLNGAELYVGDRCYRLDTSSSQSLAGLENDMGVLAAEALVDPGEVTHLLLRAAGPRGGTRTYAVDRVRLDEALRLEPGTRTDIYLSLSPVGTSGNVQTRVVAAGRMPWESTTMVMDPARGGRMTLPGGFEMEMPVGSIDKATVFGVAEYRTGGVSSLYGIWPESEVNEPVTLRFPVNRTRIPQGMQMSDYGGRINGADAASSVQGNVATVTAAASLGQVRMGTSVPYVETTGGQMMASRVSALTSTEPAGEVGAVVDNQCYRLLYNDRAYLMSLASQNAGVLIRHCENTPPYVHIVLVNLSRGALSYYPRIHFPGRRISNTTFELREITSHLASFTNDFAAINSFLWEGDTGCCGGTGTPVGTVYMNYERVSPWYTGTELMIGFGPYNPTYGTPTKFFERPAGTSLNLAGYDEWMVPATTSIIKNGACARVPGGEVNRWSTVGIGSGVLLMASSVSNTTTTAYELCSVYEGLGVLGGAIRLDGGRSAAINWQGTTLNTLTGSDYLAFGYERDIPYAIAALN